MLSYVIAVLLMLAAMLYMYRLLEPVPCFGQGIAVLVRLSKGAIHVMSIVGFEL